MKQDWKMMMVAWFGIAMGAPAATEATGPARVGGPLNTSFILPPTYRGKPATLFNECSKPGLIAFQFDGISKELLAVLDAFNALNVKITASVSYRLDFEYDRNIDAMIKTIFAQGHQIATHTYDDLVYEGEHEITPRWDQMRLNEEAINAVIGKRPLHFTRPYEFSNKFILADLGSWGYVVAASNLNSGDYEFNGPNLSKKVFERLSKAITKANPKKDSYIILAHGILEGIEWINKFIPLAREKGFRFVTMEECLGLPSYR